LETKTTEIGSVAELLRRERPVQPVCCIHALCAQVGYNISIDSGNLDLWHLFTENPQLTKHLSQPNQVPL